MSKFVEAFKKNYGKPIEAGSTDELLLDMLSAFRMASDAEDEEESEWWCLVGMCMAHVFRLQMQEEPNPVTEALEAIRVEELKPVQRVKLYAPGDVEKLMG